MEAQKNDVQEYENEDNPFRFFTLYTTSGDPIEILINSPFGKRDNDAILKSLKSFIETYNEIMDFKESKKNRGYL